MVIMLVMLLVKLYTVRGGSLSVSAIFSFESEATGLCGDRFYSSMRLALCCGVEVYETIGRRHL